MLNGSHPRMVGGIGILVQEEPDRLGLSKRVMRNSHY